MTAQRVTITHPRTVAARRGAHRPIASEIREQTHLGEIYMRALIRSQRRLAVVACVVTALLLGGIAALGAFAPWFSRIHALGIPLPWLILALLIYPVLIVLAWLTVRQAERNEHAFTELMDTRR